MVSEIKQWITTTLNFIPNAFPGSQPVNLDWKSLFNLKQRKYVVTYKSDGERALLYSEGGISYYIDRKYEFRPTSVITSISKTLLDGEIVWDIVDGKTTERYLVYDAIYVNGENVKNLPLLRRLFTFNTNLLQPSQVANTAGEIYMKDFYSTTDIDVVRNLCKRLPHPCDGLVFTPADEAYVAGRCHALLKYKEGKYNTVDFSAYITGNRIELYCGKFGRDTVWVDYAYEQCNQFVHFLNNIRNPSIVECEYIWNEHLHVGNWRIVRIRNDKDKPNDLKVLNWTYQTLENLIDYKDLQKELS